MANRVFIKEQSDALVSEVQFLVKGDYIASSQVDYMKQLLSTGVAKSIEFGGFDSEKLLWDGEIRINFARAGVKAISIVSGLLRDHHPDEIHFMTDKQLRLWWD